MCRIGIAYRNSVEAVKKYISQINMWFIQCMYVETKYTYTTNLHEGSDGCIVTELSGLVVAGKVFALPMSMMSVLFT